MNARAVVTAALTTIFTDVSRTTGIATDPLNMSKGFHQVMAVLVDEAEYREKLNALEEELSDVYRRRRALLEEFADDHEPILPPPRYRTDAQARIARCPRCGGALSEKDGAKICWVVFRGRTGVTSSA